MLQKNVNVDAPVLICIFTAAICRKCIFCESEVKPNCLNTLDIKKRMKKCLLLWFFIYGSSTQQYIILSINFSATIEINYSRLMMP